MKPRHYILSLPERSIRAAAAALGGLLYEIGQVLLPLWFRRTRLYKGLVDRLLRILIEVVGDVQGILPKDEIPSAELFARKTVGNVIEVTSFLAIGWSPLWVLAAAADLTGGTHAYLEALVTELKGAGLLKQEAEIGSTRELLDVFEQTTSRMADLVDVPPLNIPAMKASLAALKTNAAALPDPKRLAAIYKELKGVSRREGRSLGSVSGIVALSAARAGVELGQVHIFDFYRTSLNMLNEEGIAVYTLRVARPYMRAAIGHFSDQRTTRTQRLLSAVRQSRPARKSPPRQE